jgi:LmbE family N-acetylglucosaminyl deacetylase
VRQGQTHMAPQLRDCRHVLLLVAHPDDESMFFSPTIAGLTAQGTRVAIACLCSGQLQPLLSPVPFSTRASPLPEVPPPSR